MSTSNAILAVQFDRATVGLQASLMRDQIIANAALIYVPGQSGVPTTYNVAIAESQHPTIDLLQYTAALVRSDGGGSRVVMNSAKEPTIWAAYRGLMSITMKELGKKSEFAHPKRERKRVAIDTKTRYGKSGHSPSSSTSSYTSGYTSSSTSRSMSSSTASSTSSSPKTPKELRVLGLERLP